MKAFLHVPELARRSPLHYAASVLADSMALEPPLEIVEARDAESRGLLLPNGVVVPEEELQAVFSTITLGRELETGKLDPMGRFDESAIAWDVSRPWIDFRAAELAARLTADGCGMPRDQGKFRVIISHDVDRITGAELTAVAKGVLRAIGLRSDGLPTLPFSPKAYRDNLRRLLDFERAQGVKACYFLLAGPYGLWRYSSRYDVRWSQARKFIGEIREAGMTIGLHGSYYARDAGSYLAEKDRLEQAVGAPVLCHRNHYLRFDSLRVCSQLEAAGIRYEFSAGFGERMGFRAGTARTYRLFDLMHGRPANLVSVPLVYMDTPVCGIASWAERDSIFNELRALLLEAKKVQGCVSLLFHPELLLARPDLWAFFEEIIHLSKELGADLSAPLPDSPKWLGHAGRLAGGDSAAAGQETPAALPELCRGAHKTEGGRRSIPPLYPGGHSFAFTIIDDTDNGTVENLKPLYDLLQSLGMRTTKTIWVYPSRDRFLGDSLADPECVRWLLDLHGRGFEIGLHGVGSGEFSRREILEGLDRFKDVFGRYPTIHTNHSQNPDNLYWSPRNRMVPPFGLGYTLVSTLVRLLGWRKCIYRGEDPASPHFWGDVAKQHVKYIRNLTFNGINTLAYDPRMPYQVPSKARYSNYWFSSSDGRAVEEFVALLAQKNVDRLEAQRGTCIVYTHFASGFVRDGRVDPQFEARLRHLVRRNGWFVPASEVLGHLLARQGGDRAPGYPYLARVASIWLQDRLLKVLRYHR